MRRFFTSALLALSLAAPLAADVYTVDKGHSEASFQVRHMVTKVRGRFNDFSGVINIDPAKPESSSVEFTIQAASIDSQSAKRDEHLRGADFFDVEKHPTITFKSSRVRPAGKDRYEVTGTLTMRGVSKVITLPVAFLGFVKTPWGGEVAGFETEVTLNRKDYGINWNKSLDAGGVLVADEVLVTINVEAGKKKDVAAN
jgi:polyisoprenoid-binding protein YceI